MIIMGNVVDEWCVFVMEWKRRGEESERKEGTKELWDLLEAKPRLMIGWRDSAGFLTSLG